MRNRENVRRSNSNRQPLFLSVLPALENPPRDIPVDIHILLTVFRIRVLVLKVPCAPEHRQHDGERVLRVIEANVEDGAGVY